MMCGVLCFSLIADAEGNVSGWNGPGDFGGAIEKHAPPVTVSPLSRAACPTSAYAA